MKLYDLGAGLMIGIILMAGASKMNHDANQDPPPTVVEAECQLPKAMPDFVVTSGELAKVARVVKPGQTILVIKPHPAMTTSTDQVISGMIEGLKKVQAEIKTEKKGDEHEQKK